MKQKLKICVISTTILPALSPSEGGYGGLEPIAWSQAAGLARRGHEVLLVATNGSIPPKGVELHQTTIGESEKQAYSGYWNRLPNYNVIIDNSWNKWSYILKIEGKLPQPILGVCHAPVDTMYGSAPPVLFPCLVGISQDMVDHISQHLGVSARCAYNGIDLEFYKRKLGIERGSRYLFLARMSRIKGPHIAVDLARKLRFGLDLVGDDKITGEPDLAQRMHMMSVHNIKYHGGVSRERAVEFFSQAKALLHMNQCFREPFGLAPVEAQACGLPIIVFDLGAMRETVVHGKTGFLVKSVAEVEELIKHDAVKSIKSEDCRENAKRFSVKNMVSRYEELCYEALECPW